MNRILSRLLFLLLLPGAACSRDGDEPEFPASSVHIETRNGERLIDLNLFAFDATTGVLLGQQYRVDPESTFHFPEIPAGSLVRLAAIGNVGEKRLGKAATYDDLMQVEVPLDSLEGARLHKEGCWLMVSDRTNRASIVRTDTLAAVTLQPLFTRLGLRIDATALKQWNVELRDVRLMSPEGICHIWARTFAPVGKDFPQCPTSEEFTSLQNALSSKERTPAVYFHVPDASAEESEARVQVTARLHAKDGSMVLNRTWTARVKDLQPINWDKETPLSAILHLTDGNAGVDGQWSCIDEPSRMLRIQLANAPSGGNALPIRSAAVLLFSTLPPAGFHDPACTPLLSGMANGNEVCLDIRNGSIGNAQPAYYLAVANPTAALYQRLLQPEGPLDEVFTTCSEEDPEYPLMWSCGTLDLNGNGDTALSLPVRCGLVKVSISHIRHSLRDDNRSLTLKGLFLINASACFFPHFLADGWDMDRDAYCRKYYHPSACYTPGTDGWPSTSADGYGMTSAAPSFMRLSTLKTVQKGNAIDDTFVLYTYPNSTVEDAWSTLAEVHSWSSLEGNWLPRHTRLVLEVEIGGQTCWYPITLPTLLPGRWYKIDEVRLTNSASSSPDIPASRIDPVYALHVLNWGYASLRETI